MKRLIIFIAAAALLLAACAAPGTETAAPPEATMAVQTTQLANEETQPMVTQVERLAIGQDGDTDTNTAVVAMPQEDVITVDTYADLYEQWNPSVVNIRIVRDSTSLPEMHEGVPDFPEDFPNQPFGEIPQQSIGSGFVFDQQGHIITNNHVVANAETIFVTFANDQEVEAELIGTDPNSDLAVIRVVEGAEALVPMVLGDSDSIRVGQLVTAIGNPFGLDGSMSTGIISGLGRQLANAVNTSFGSFSIPDIIQTDTAINPGNSGGPLLNLDGEVIGVNTAIESPVRGFAGIGYAVPVNTVRRVVPQLIENGAVAYPWLGLAGRTLTPATAVVMDLDADQRGVLVVQVVEDGPSGKAGLLGSNEEVTIDGAPALAGGDVIVRIGEQTVSEFEDLLTFLVRETAVGETIDLEVLRDGELVTLEITLEARPSQ